MLIPNHYIIEWFSLALHPSIVHSFMFVIVVVTLWTAVDYGYMNRHLLARFFCKQMQG
jgi:hypothetical protein